MMKTYSHIRRQALDEAASAFEPTPIPPTGTVAVDAGEAPLIG